MINVRTPLKKRLVIVEDDLELSNGFAMIINTSPRFQVVKTYNNCEDAIKNLSNDNPDMVLMDIELPGMNGLKGTSQIKARSNSIEVVMLTVYEDSQFVFEALRCGATGYITKSANHTELLNALEEILKGGAPMSSRIARMVIENFRMSTNSPLSKRETEILTLISQGKTYTQIANELHIANETSKTHIRNIYQKLHVNNKAEALAVATSGRLI